MDILISNRQRKYQLCRPKIEQTAQIILDALDCPDGELSLAFLDDAQIAALNHRYLKRTGPTNVIAFPMQTGPFADISPQLLGDVVISVETAAKEAAQADVPFQERLTALMVHGILHLFGYRHEDDEQAARRMQVKSKALMACIRSALPMDDV